MRERLQSSVSRAQRYPKGRPRRHDDLQSPQARACGRRAVGSSPSSEDRARVDLALCSLDCLPGPREPFTRDTAQGAAEGTGGVLSQSKCVTACHSTLSKWPYSMTFRASINYMAICCLLTHRQTRREIFDVINNWKQ